jgi:hypothetical protein
MIGYNKCESNEKRSNIVAEACISSVLPKPNSCMRFNLSGE